MKKSLLFSLLLSAPLHATTVLIDFGTVVTTGTSPTWNNFTDISGATSLSLVDTSGAVTGYSLGVSGNVNGLSDNPTTSLTNTYSPFTPDTVIQDSIFQSTSRIFTLTGLNPALTYDLTFFAYVNRDTTRDTNIAISGKPTLTLHPSGVPSAHLNSGGEAGTISAVTPNGSGVISFTVSNVNANWILNGMSIDYTIPEPSALLLSVFGLVPLLRRRR